MAGRCGIAGEDLREALCRNSSAATHLKLLSLAAIFLASVVGISSPVLLARRFQGSSSYASAVLLIKCYAAGVILSTSLVHVLPDAFEALLDCAVAVRHPWRDFPFSGLVCLIGVLLALLVDAAAASHAEEEQAKPKYEPIGKGGVAVTVVEAIELGGCHGTHSHSNHHGAVDVGGGNDDEDDSERAIREKQRLVSKVLEIGIIFHSVIIGVTMGMSQNQCTIRPLVVALSFHQVFEGMGLGGCIAQAGFGMATTSYMCIMFSVTTPMGILLGMMIFYLTGYDDSNPNALISEGLLGSLSAGVLVYMALVDLIAVDFFHNKKMSSNPKLKKACFVALVLGSASMSILALWA